MTKIYFTKIQEMHGFPYMLIFEEGKLHKPLCVLSMNDMMVMINEWQKDDK